MHLLHVVEKADLQSCADMVYGLLLFQTFSHHQKVLAGSCQKIKRVMSDPLPGPSLIGLLFASTRAAALASSCNANHCALCLHFLLTGQAW